MPVSVTAAHDLVYVVNAAAATSRAIGSANTASCRPLPIPIGL